MNTFCDPALATTTDPTDGSPAGLADSPAEQLFWERARLVNPDVRRNGDRRAVAALCRRLDGLPLAIELAAARAALLPPPAALLDRLSDGLALLSTGTRDAPERQRSLRACLEWSVGLLDDEERQLFACMSVFAGGATFGDAESVAGSVVGAIDSLDLIESLVSKSLLTVHQGPTGSRVMMLETIREYAAELLASDSDEATVRSAHALHYHALLASEPSIVAWPPRNALEATRLVEELPNARVALAKLQHDGRHDLASDLVVSLFPLLRLRGAVTEVLSYVEPLLARADLTPSRRADLLFYDSAMALVTADHETARVHLLEASAIVEANPDDAQEAYVHASLGWLAVNTGDARTAAHELALARAASQRAGDPEMIAAMDACLDTLGDIPLIEDALATAREHHNQVLERMVLINLSELVLDVPGRGSAHPWPGMEPGRLPRRDAAG